MCAYAHDTDAAKCFLHQTKICEHGRDGLLQYTTMLGQS